MVLRRFPRFRWPEIGVFEDGRHGPVWVFSLLGEKMSTVADFKVGGNFLSACLGRPFFLCNLHKCANCTFCAQICRSACLGRPFFLHLCTNVQFAHLCTNVQFVGTGQSALFGKVLSAAHQSQYFYLGDW